MKRILTVVLSAVFMVSGAQAFAADSAIDGREKIFFIRAQSLLKMNNSTLAVLKNSERQAYREYRDTAESSRGVNTETKKITVFGHEVTIHFDKYTQMLLTKKRDLLPAAMEYKWATIQDNREAAANTLAIALRGMYAGLLNADFDQKIKNSEYDLTAKVNKQDRQKYADGMITGGEMDLSDYNLLKAAKNLEASARNRQNACRSLNAFMGIAEPGKEYGDVLFEEVYDGQRLKKLDYYVDNALAQRLELKTIESRLALKELEKDIYEKTGANVNYTAGISAYRNLLIDIEGLEAELDIQKLEIKDEIRNAYADVLKNRMNVLNLRDSLDLKEKTLAQLKLSCENGLTPLNVFDEASIGVQRLEAGCSLALFAFNTKLMMLEGASGIGPAYKKG